MNSGGKKELACLASTQLRKFASRIEGQKAVLATHDIPNINQMFMFLMWGKLVNILVRNS